MYDEKKEIFKMKLFRMLMILFLLLTLIGAGYVLYSGGTVSAGYSVVPCLFTLIFSMLTRNSKKAIEENTQKNQPE